MPVLQHKAPFHGYEGGEKMPLTGYATLLGLWSAFFGAAYMLARREERGGADRQAWADLALLALATHKLSRIITHDWVTAPVRAPFVKYKESIGAGEVREESRGGEMRRAVGDLLTCEFCIAPWVATGLLAAHAVAPGPTRFLATVFSMAAVSDFLNQAYTRIEQS